MQARKYEKKYEKVMKSPTPGKAPKIRKKYRKNIRKWPENDGFVNFCFFFSRIFGVGVGDFVTFSYFFVFPGLRGF